MHGRVGSEDCRLGQVSVQRGEAAHLPEVLAMTETCPDAPYWPAGAWQAFVQGEVEGSHQVLLLARGAEGELLGWLAASGMFETAELEFVLVRPEARGQGVGRELVRCWMRAMEREGVREALLEVRASNVSARRLYESLGFEVQGVRHGYYERPREDALTMRRMLPVADGFPPEAGTV